MVGSTVSLAFASAPDFENHGDDDGDGDYAVTLTVDDGSNFGTSINYVVTVTDVEDQALSYSSASLTPSIAENTTAIETLTITNAETVDIYGCTFAGDMRYSLVRSPTSVALSFASAPDFDIPVDTVVICLQFYLVIDDSTNNGSTLIMC